MASRVARSLIRATAGTIALSVLTFVGTCDLTARQDLSDSILTLKKAIVTHSPMSKAPLRIINMQLPVTGLQKTPNAFSPGNVEIAIHTFLQSNRGYFQVNPEDLRLRTVAKAGKDWRIIFQQEYKGIPLEGATVGLTVTQDGVINTYSSSYAPGLDLPVTPAVVLPKAIAIAKGTLDTEYSRTVSESEATLIIYPMPSSAGSRYYLAWKFLLAGTRPTPDKDSYFIIDAQSARILTSYPLRANEQKAYGTVRGMIYPVNPNSPPVATEPLAHAYVGVLFDGMTVTNGQGNYSLSLPWWFALFPTYTAVSRLEGPFTHVMDSTGGDCADTHTCNMNSACDFTWPATDQTNVFYHMNLYHDWLQSHLLFSWTNPWDGSSQFNADVGFTFANAYDGNPMQFGRHDFATSSDVIYHESTHNVIYSIFGSHIGVPRARTEAYACDEGFADYFACTFTDDPTEGEGCGVNRNLNNTHKYVGKASYNSEGHDGGTIISGAAWDFREAMVSEMGHDAGIAYADAAIFSALEFMSTFPRDYYFSDPQESNFLTSLYIALDDNSNLSDGVPHFEDVQSAFAKHNLLQAVLVNGNSYDASTNAVGWFTGGDFYYTSGKFFANNYKQRGVVDLGDIGATSLDNASIPRSGYTRFGVASVVGHTYVALAQEGEEGRYIVFKVTRMNTDQSQVTIEYRCRNPLWYPPDKLCIRFPKVCMVALPCDKYPQACQSQLVFPVKNGLEFKIRFIDEKILVPFEKICQYVVNCPGCGSGALCAGYLIRFTSLPDPFEVQILNSDGRVVSTNIPHTNGRALQFKTREGESYFMIVGTKSPAQVGKSVTMAIAVQELAQ